MLKKILKCFLIRVCHIYTGLLGDKEEKKRDPLIYLHFWVRRGLLGMGIVLDKSNLILLGSYGPNFFLAIT